VSSEILIFFVFFVKKLSNQKSSFFLGA
jgi:hypothetical protein